MQGGCLCAALRYRVTNIPQSSIVCHCNTCRKAHSAPSVAWLTFDRGGFQWLSGKPSRFVSSAGVVRSFCAACGSPLTWEGDDSRDSIDVATVTLDDADAFPPTREVWLEHSLPWQARNEALGQFPRGSDEAPYGEPAGPLGERPA